MSAVGYLSNVPYLCPWVTFNATNNKIYPYKIFAGHIKMCSGDDVMHTGVVSNVSSFCPRSNFLAH